MLKTSSEIFFKCKKSYSNAQKLLQHSKSLKNSKKISVYFLSQQFPGTPTKSLLSHLRAKRYILFPQFLIFSLPLIAFHFPAKNTEKELFIFPLFPFPPCCLKGIFFTTLYFPSVERSQSNKMFARFYYLFLYFFFWQQCW